MNISRVRSALLGSAVGVAMVAASGTANALEYNFGDVQVFFDTTVTAGVSVRVAETNALFLPEGNGGPLDQRTLLGGAAGGTVAAPSAAAFAPGSLFVPDDSQPDNFGGSVNGDDGRLNFDRWDLTAGTLKVTNDIQANWSNYTFFARVNSFYDAVLDRDSSFARSNIDDGAKTDAARDIDVLDFYVSGDFNVGNLPLNVRVGKQVVNWGEATFILNGISSWNPFDVNAFRRPGAEIREGLLPIWGAYASIGLPFDLSLEAFYQFEFQELQLDRAGTPFASTDVAKVGSQFGGNVGGIAFTSGSQRSGTFKRNCDGGTVLSGVVAPGCAQGDGSFIDYRDDIPIGINEQVRIANGDLSIIRRGVDREAKDTGQYGVALRWYAEELNSTEFGFYFMNYHSRLPFVSRRTLAPVVGITVTNASTTALTRQLTNAGCLSPDLFADVAAVPFAAPGILNTANVTGLFAATTIGNPSLAGGAATATTAGGGPILDPLGLLSNAALDAAIDATAIGLAGAVGTKAIVVSGTAATLAKLASINCVLAASQSNFVGAGTFAAVTAGFVDPLNGTPAEIAARSAAVTAALGFLPSNEGGLSDALPLLNTGAELLSLTFQSELFLEYPEDIQLFGVSFNTTLGDWGVQGEVAYRRDQPLQLDNDAITIAAAAASCAFTGGDAILLGFEPLVNQGTSCAGSLGSGGVVGQEITGFVREEVVTFDIGTTATYTNSNPLIGALGADIGILLTEVGAMYVPDAPGEGTNATRLLLSNVCTSGTDLALGGLLALDFRSGCRASTFSYGYVLVGILQYNNAFGTPITLSPQIA
ncbi:MAG: hypothetical protein COA62_12610, partial [Rhodobiaceae bacterium]